MPKVKADQVWTEIIIIASLVFLAVSRSIISGAGYPRAMLILVIVLALVSLVISVRKGRAEAGRVMAGIPEVESAEARGAESGQISSPENGRKAKEVVILAISPFLYVGLWNFVGFLAATVLFLFGLFSYKKVPWIKGLITAVVAAIVIEYVFGTVFQVSLPMLGWLPLL